MTSELLAGLLALEPTLGTAALCILDGEDPVVHGTAAVAGSKEEEEPDLPLPSKDS